MCYIEDNYDTTNWLFNTAVLGANKNTLEKVNLFDKFYHMKSLVSESKEEEFYPRELCEWFRPNNEVFYTYCVEQQGLSWNNIDTKWHHVHYKELTNDTVRYDNNEPWDDAYFIHMISKDFGKYYD